MTLHLILRRRNPIQSMDAPVIGLLLLGVAMVILLVVTR